MSTAALFLGLFAVALVLTLVVRRRSRWILLVGAAAAVVWWIATSVADLATGCSEDLEVRCNLRWLFFGALALAMLASWAAGVGVAVLIRRLTNRDIARP